MRIIDTHMLYLLIYNDLVGVHKSCSVRARKDHILIP